MVTAMVIVLVILAILVDVNGIFMMYEIWPEKESLTLL